MIVLAQISRQIESVQRVSVCIILSTYIVAFILVIFTRPAEQTCIPHDGLVCGEVCFYRSNKLRLTVQEHFHLSQAVMLEIEWVLVVQSVLAVIVHHADYETCGYLAVKHILLSEVEMATRNRKRLAHDSTYRVLCVSNFQGLGMSDKDARADFYLSNQKLDIVQFNFECRLSHIAHQTEGIFASHQSQSQSDIARQK